MLRKAGFGCVLLLGLVAAACSSPSSVNTSGTAHSNVVQSKSTGSASRPTTTTTESTADELKVVGQGFTQLPPDDIGNSYVTAAAVVQWNGSNKIATVEVTFSFLSATGSVVKSDTETVDAIWPGQTAAVDYNDQASGVTNMKVQALVTDTASFSGQPVTITTSGVSTTADDIGDEQTAGTIATNATKDLKNVYAVAVYYNLAGVILGGDDTFVDFIPAGGSTSFQISGTNSVPGVAGTLTKVYANPSNLTIASAAGNSGNSG